MLFGATGALLQKSSVPLKNLLQESFLRRVPPAVISRNTSQESKGHEGPHARAVGQEGPSYLIHNKQQLSQLPYESRSSGGKISSARCPSLVDELPDFMEISESHRNDELKEIEQKAYAEENKKPEKKWLSVEQQIVRRLALDGASLFIGGDAGTGKSFLLRCIAESLEAKGLNVLVTASTGIAAVGIGGNTFHSTFGVPVTSDDEKDASTAGAAAHIWYDTESLAVPDVIIVDEVSLLHAGYIEALDLAARMAPGRSQNKPFGGIQVILSGDFLQLMPGCLWSRGNSERLFCAGVEKKGVIPTGVTPEMEKPTVSQEEKFAVGVSSHPLQRESTLLSVKRRRQLLCFYCDRPVYESTTFEHCLLHVRLSEPARQREDPEYLEDLNKLRRGILTHRLSRSAVHNPEDPDAIRLFPVKRAVTAFNASKMLELSGEERCFKSEFHVTSGNEATLSARRSTKGDCRTYPDLLVVHFRNKPMRSAKWRRQAEELIRQLCSQCKLNGAVRILIPPVSSRYSNHLSVYVCFVGPTRSMASCSMTALRSALENNFIAKSKDAAAARKHWGTILWEVRKIDFLRRFLLFSLERRYAKVIQRDQVLQHKRLKVGCRVMLLRNLNRNYVNGSLGTVVGFQPLQQVEHLLPTGLKVRLPPGQYAALNHLKRHSSHRHAPAEKKKGACNDGHGGTIVPVVRMDSDGKEVAIPWVSLSLPWEQREGFYAVRIVAMPLTPAYAYTVHKVQGLTFDHSVLFDGSGFFPCDHLIYVAASRVKRFSQFRMINVSPRMVSVHRGALRFMSGIPSVAEAAKKWAAWKRTWKGKETTRLSKEASTLSTLPPDFSLFCAEWKLRPSGRAKQK
ncbi:PIF1 helicase-like protein, putative [Trypanosoma cruzi marinkellei]|uniref:ATP-dependent DNA helicase n=1 Tax=Trypanosoma cruzi marinkellei TaxID=85056 RepID=K2NWE3_TRYCR|nr:PIF1 helicase-like protein, putative [Trypanosoma cruzi marinkellei]